MSRRFARSDVGALRELALDARVDRQYRALLQIAVELLRKGDFDGGCQDLSIAVTWVELPLDESMRLVEWLWRHPDLQYPDPRRPPHAPAPASRYIMQVALGQIVHGSVVSADETHSEWAEPFRPHHALLADAWAEATLTPEGGHSDWHATEYMQYTARVLEQLDDPTSRHV